MPRLGNSAQNLTLDKYIYLLSPFLKTHRHIIPMPKRHWDHPMASLDDCHTSDRWLYTADSDLFTRSDVRDMGLFQPPRATTIPQSEAECLS